MRSTLSLCLLCMLLTTCGEAPRSVEVPNPPPPAANENQNREFGEAVGLPAELVGSWEVYRFEEVFGHARDFYPAEMLGEKIEIDHGSVSWPPGFLWMGGEGCVEPTYVVHRVDPDSLFGSDAQGTLQYHGRKERRDGEVAYLIIDCPEVGGPYLELTAGIDLAYYYDGYFLFLRQAG